MSESTIEALINSRKAGSWLNHWIEAKETALKVTSGANILSYLFWYKHLPSGLKKEHFNTLDLFVRNSASSGLTEATVTILNWLYEHDRSLFDDPKVLVCLHRLACRKAGKYWHCNIIYGVENKEAAKLVSIAAKENSPQLLDLVPFSHLLREAADGRNFVCDYLLERAKDKEWAIEYYRLYGNNIREGVEEGFSSEEMQALEPIIQTLMRSVVRKCRKELTEKVTRHELLKRLASHSELLMDMKPIDEKLGKSLMREMTKAFRTYGQGNEVLEFNIANRATPLIRYLGGNKDFPSISKDDIVKLVTSGTSVAKVSQCKTPSDIKALFKLSRNQHRVLESCKESVIVAGDSDFYAENERTLDFLHKRNLIDKYGEFHYICIPDEYREREIRPLIAVSHTFKGKQELVVENLSNPEKSEVLEKLIRISDAHQLDSAIWYLKNDERHLQTDFGRMTAHEAQNYGILTEALTDGFYTARQELTAEWGRIKEFLKSAYPYCVIIPGDGEGADTIFGRLIQQQKIVVYVPHELAGKSYLMKVRFTMSKDEIAVCSGSGEWAYKASQSQMLEEAGLKTNLHESFIKSADSMFFLDLYGVQELGC